MEPDFWLSRWEEGRTGFHEDGVHEDLRAQAARFLGDAPRDVLVPLCGKSVDLDWLAAAGHRVTGVELSPVAAGIVRGRMSAPHTDAVAGFTRHRAGSWTLLQGDVFGLADLDLRFDRIWDRAALVALPPSMRPAYAALMGRLLVPGGLLLQNSFSYEQSKMEGPPFSVPAEELAALYPGWPCEPLRSTPLDEPRWRDRGVTDFTSHLALLVRP